MDTFLVHLILIGGNAIGCHQCLIRMTAPTHSRFVAWIDLGSRVRDLERAMPAVTVKAGGDVRVTFQKRLAVHALPILAELVRGRV